ncbi:serpentine type 7TM GPCR chemoreceptor srd domain-containing protein [Ditylenchus destructor]|nr:serpentine type 7TM GPCR chemoreceptor srd domain-containing protein [Ditylenchus destructor]
MDEVHHVIETTVNTLSILFNCYLLYLIRYYSTFKIKLYQYLLSIDAMLDLCLGVSAIVAQPVGLTGEGFIVAVMNGFFAGQSSFFDSLSMTFYLFTLHVNVIWIPVQFFYRYRLLCGNSAKSAETNILITIVTVAYSAVAFVVIMNFCQVRDEYQPIGLRVLDLNNWSNQKNGFVLGGHIKEWKVIAHVILWTTTSWASIFIVIWCEKRINKIFKPLGHLSHGNGQRMHKEFQRALLAMAIFPLFTSCIPVLYFVTTIAFQMCPGRISAIMTIFLSSVSLFNPLTTITCFRCYRQATVRFVTCGRRSASVSSTTNAGCATGSSAIADKTNATSKS